MPKNQTNNEGKNVPKETPEEPKKDEPKTESTKKNNSVAGKSGAPEKKGAAPAKAPTKAAAKTGGQIKKNAKAKKAEGKFKFKVMDPQVKSFESKFDLNGSIKHMICVDGIIKTDDEDLAAFLNTQPTYQMQ